MALDNVQMSTPFLFDTTAEIERKKKSNSHNFVNGQIEEKNYFLKIDVSCFVVYKSLVEK